MYLNQSLISPNFPDPNSLPNRPTLPLTVHRASLFDRQHVPLFFWRPSRRINNTQASSYLLTSSSLPRLRRRSEREQLPAGLGAKQRVGQPQSERPWIILPTRPSACDPRDAYYVPPTPCLSSTPVGFQKKKGLTILQPPNRAAQLCYVLYIARCSQSVDGRHTETDRMFETVFIQTDRSTDREGVSTDRTTDSLRRRLDMEKSLDRQTDGPGRCLDRPADRWTRKAFRQRETGRVGVYTDRPTDRA